MKETILITGGTGFLGRRLAIALKDRFRVILGSRNNKLNAAAQAFTGCESIPLDVVNIESVRDAFVASNPNIVIHAAATKFVDLAERQPMECVDVNVLGSQNVARVALERGVGTVVGISTDKAAPPVRNTYGLSKALMERVFCSCNLKNGITKFLCVRYGNVAWSTGSVLSIWKKMHDATGVIGTTGPTMRRFFFTVDEAVNLVVTALDNAKALQGKILSRHMKAALMQDLLDTYIKHKGGRWEIIEARPGERDDEFLIGDLELPYTQALSFDGIKHFVISFNQKAESPLSVGLSSANTERLSADEMLRLLDAPPVEEL